MHKIFYLRLTFFIDTATIDIYTLSLHDALPISYVSLNEDNPELKRYLPWTGTNQGPEAIVRAFEGIGRAWETKAFQVREVIEQGDRVAMFGSFTYRGRQSGQEITSPFSLLAKLRDGKIHYVQFLEDTFGTSGTLGRPRS